MKFPGKRATQENIDQLGQAPMFPDNDEWGVKKSTPQHLKIEHIENVDQ